MKKVLALAVVASMLSATAAGSVLAEENAASMKGNGDAKLTVFVYAQEYEKAIYEQLIEEYVQEHADEIGEVVFEVTTSDEYGTKMIANMTANDMPDIFYVGPESVKSYADNGYIQPLDDLVDSEVVDQLWPALMTAYRYDGDTVGEGSLYCLPKDLSCFAFAYNKDLFDEAGLDYPDPENPYTYDEFIEVCQALTKDTDGDGEIDQWGVANANQWGMTPYLYSNGARFLTDDYTTVNLVDNEAMKNAFEFYVGLTTEYGVTPSVEQDTALGGYQRWLDGQIGFYACGTWDVAAFMDKATFPYEWDLCAYPIGPDYDKSSTWLGTVGYAVSASTEYPELAAGLITKLSTDQDGQEAVSGYSTGQSIQLPNIMDFAKGDYREAVENGDVPYASNIDVIYNYIEGTDKYQGIFSETTYTPNDEWWTIFWSGVVNVQQGDVSVEEFFEEIQDEMQESLDDAYDEM